MTNQVYEVYRTYVNVEGDTINSLIYTNSTEEGAKQSIEDDAEYFKAPTFGHFYKYVG